MSDIAARLAFVDARLSYEIDVVAAAEAVAEGRAVLVDTRSPAQDLRSCISKPLPRSLVM
ncbi:hypothetical protein [Microbacterium sp. XT11]|uniref:hypothetical protein n=1 Tax=Microbacterium sp. XT11 TaxID=367477 RepID=UPI00082D9843|nr:hypothetical protein [Microbacterium sp. XT11]